MALSDKQIDALQPGQALWYTYRMTVGNTTMRKTEASCVVVESVERDADGKVVSAIGRAQGRQGQGVNMDQKVIDAIEYLQETYKDAKPLIGDGGRERCLKEAIERVQALLPPRLCDLGPNDASFGCVVRQPNGAVELLCYPT